MPARCIHPDGVRSLLAATELRESCRLGYQSMTSANPATGPSPSRAGQGVGRYHVRAFDFSRKRFIDFSLSRVLSSMPLADDASVPSTLDDDWHAMIEVEFVPHPRLSSAQRLTIAREFGMVDGTR